MAILCALLHSLCALGIASQQSIALNRLRLHPRHLEILRRVLLIHTSTTNAATPNPTLYFSSASVQDSPRAATELRHFAWQVPVTLFGNSVIFVVVGLAVAVFSEAQKASQWGSECITAICFTISLMFCTVCYFVSWMYVEWNIQKTLKEM